MTVTRTDTFADNSFWPWQLSINGNTTTAQGALIFS